MVFEKPDLTGSRRPGNMWDNDKSSFLAYLNDLLKKMSKNDHLWVKPETGPN